MAPWKSLQEIGDFDSLVPWDRPLERAPFDRYALWFAYFGVLKSAQKSQAWPRDEDCTFSRAKSTPETASLRWEAWNRFRPDSKNIFTC